MKAKKLTFKKGETFMSEAKFVHKGEQYLWGISASGYNSIFIFNSEGCTLLGDDAYRKLVQELGL
jgi:hypothetical protein